MVVSDEEFAAELERRKNRFRVLVCIDGTEDSYRGLNYASVLARGPNADIILLYVRPVDQGMRTGGLQVRVARENMLNWGLELPGINYLKKGRDILIEQGDMELDWDEKVTHTDVEGDPLGDNKIEYTNAAGKSIVLKLKVAPTIAAGILDQYELGPYDLIIIDEGGDWGGWAKSLWDPAVAQKVAMHAPCSVLVTRHLVRGHGHLVCTDGSETALETVRKATEIVKRTEALHLSVLSVARDEASEPEAQRFADEAAGEIEKNGLVPRDAFTAVGDPIEKIIEAGRAHSIIMVGPSGRTGLKRFFLGSIAYKVVEHAETSVMVVR